MIGKRVIFIRVAFINLGTFYTILGEVQCIGKYLITKDQDLCDRNQPAGQIGQEKGCEQPAAPQGGKPQPLELFFSKRFHGMLCRGKYSSNKQRKPGSAAA